MSIIKSKIISSLEDILNNSNEAISKNNEDMSIFKIIDSTANSVNQLATQGELKYTSEFSNLFAQIINFIKNSDGDLTKNDMGLIKFFYKKLKLVFQNEDILDIVKYDNIAKQSSKYLSKYSSSSVDFKKLYKQKYTLVLESNDNNTPYMQMIDAFKTKYEDTNFTNNQLDILLNEKILCTIYFILEQFNSFAKSKNIHNLSINNYITNGSLCLEINAKDNFIDFDFVYNRALEIGLIEEGDINKSALFDILLSGDFFDNKDIFINLKKISLKLGCLNAKMKYQENTDTIIVIIYCNYFIDSSLIKIQNNKYLVPNVYIKSISNNYTKNKTQTDNEIQIISNNEYLNITNPTDDDCLIIAQIQNTNFGFYCNKVIGQQSTEICSFVKNYENMKIPFLLGFSKHQEEIIFSLDLFNIAQKIHNE